MTRKNPSPRADVAIVGAGAAGLATAIFTRRASPRTQVLLLDGARTPGAKILVSGGGRCNVTNASVGEGDFWGGRRAIVRRVLRAFPERSTIAFFAGLGVRLREESDGKLFPDSNRARDVLDALLDGARVAGVELRTGTRVEQIAADGAGFVLQTPAGALSATAVVLATGGQSLPKTGSDGAGYAFARALGHTIVTPTPALAPLVLDPGTPHSIHRDLSGVSVDGEIAVRIDGAISARLAGSLLWTHFGVSGPLALDASRHWARAVIDGRAVRLSLNVMPGCSFEAVDERWMAASAASPRATVRSHLARGLPDAAASAIVRALALPPDRILADLTRDERRRLVHGITEWPLPVIDTRGYNFAEVTAGGVALEEIDPSSMESRIRRGLYLVGEILDVDGRIGGFNFQWAWSSAFVAASALSRR